MTELLNEARNAIYALIAALFGLGAHVWRKTEARVEALEAGKAGKADVEKLATKIDLKADETEMGRQRDNIAALFDGQTAIRKEMHENHVATMRAFGDIAAQVANLTGRIEK